MVAVVGITIIAQSVTPKWVRRKSNDYSRRGGIMGTYEICQTTELCHVIEATSKEEALGLARDKGEIDARTNLIKDWHVKRKEGNPMTTQEMEELATMVAEKVKEDTSIAVLLLHSTPHAYGSPGIMVDPDVAARTPCKCYDNICFSRGIIGTLDKAQREAYCPTTQHVSSPGMTKRLKNWQEAVDVCKAEIEPVPKGERLMPWLSCMGRELPARGIEI